MDWLQLWFKLKIMIFLLIIVVPIGCLIIVTIFTSIKDALKNKNKPKGGD